MSLFKYKSEKKKKDRPSISKQAKASGTAQPQLQDLQKQVLMLQTYQEAYDDQVNQIEEKEAKIRNLEVTYFSNSFLLLWK